MSNIIQFPTSKIKLSNPHLSDADRELLLLKEKINVIETSLEYVTTEAVAMVHRLGFDITREDYVKDVTLIVDAIRGLMYRTSGLEYPIHKWVDESYTMADDGEYAYNPEWFNEKGETTVVTEADQEGTRYATVDEDGNFIETDEDGNPLNEK